MYLSQLKLMNFRNYDFLELEADNNINIFIGDNAQGKTNLLESIYMIGRGKSYKNNINDLIKWNKDSGIIQGNIISEGIKDNVKINLKNNKAEIFYNQKKITKKNTLSSNIYIILFSPEDLKLIKEGPDNRRKFLDSEITIIKPQYDNLIKKYSKVLMQRNNLLKSLFYDKSSIDTIDIWNEQLIELGSKIIFERIKFLKKLNDLTKVVHKELTKGKEDIQIYYISNLIKNHDDINNIKSIYRESLKDNFNIEKQKGSTSIGPHLDDIKVTINNYDAKIFGSQGQQRTVALSLKLSEIQLIKIEKKENPIILLDDVMSELDASRQREIIHYFRELQVFITCTDLNFQNYIQNYSKKIYTIHQGKIINIT